MARSVITGITSVCATLIVTATIATSSSAMTFSDYDSSSGVLGNRADVSQLFSGRLTAEQNRRAEQAEALKDLRENREIVPQTNTNLLEFEGQRPISLTLPF